MNTTDRRCLWCGRNTASVPDMRFATEDRKCPCADCQLLLSKRHSGSTAQSGAGQPVYVRRKGVKTPRPPKGSE